MAGNRKQSGTAYRAGPEYSRLGAPKGLGLVPLRSAELSGASEPTCLARVRGLAYGRTQNASVSDKRPKSECDS